MSEILSPTPAWAMSFLIIAVKTTVVLALALAVLRLVPRLTSASRCAILVCAVATGLLLPVLDRVMPAWRVLPRLTVVTEPSTQPIPSPSQAPRALPAMDREASVPRPASPDAVMLAADEPIAAEPERGISIWVWALGLWLAGIAWIVLRVFPAGLLQTLESRRLPVIDDPDWQRLLESCAAKLGLARRPVIRIHPDAIMPTTYGVVRATILLPVAAECWVEEKRRAVLLHELAHIRRGDLGLQTMMILACALQWFNPLMWAAYRRFIIERERACDDMVLRAGVRPRTYARDLLQMAADFNAVPRLGACMAKPNELETRLMSILDKKRSRRGMSLSRGLCISILTLAVVMPLSALALAEPAERERLPANPEVVRLAEALESTDVAIRQLAAERIRAMDRDDELLIRVSEYLFDTWDDDSRVFREFATLDMAPGTDRQAMLLTALTDDFPVNRAAAAMYLAAYDDPLVVEALANAINDENRHVREWAIRSLGSIGDAAALPAMIEGLDDVDPQVREWSARALAGMDDPRAVDALVVAMGDSEAQVREWAARTLGSIGDSGTLPALIDGLDDTAAQVREWSARSLAGVDDPAVVQGLLQAMKDDEPEVREWAIRSLGSIGDPNAVPFLVEGLDDSVVEVREWSVRALGSIGDPSAVDALIAAMDDDSAVVREWSARSLGSIGDPIALDALIAGCADPVAEVREWSVRSLGSLGDRRALDALTELLDDRNAEVREWAKRAIAGIAAP